MVLSLPGQEEDGGKGAARLPCSPGGAGCPLARTVEKNVSPGFLFLARRVFSSALVFSHSPTLQGIRAQGMTLLELDNAVKGLCLNKVLS